MPVEITIKVSKPTETGRRDISQKFSKEDMESQFSSDWTYEITKELLRMIDRLDRDHGKYEKQ
jgi:hypothetical protein